ncbi:hypothetical protein GCM10022267_13830 [Lentzea roselyniae]|uniref:Uncharacterized protein n=1 Tax=Lentzea roselyniae TaxID=531940 RepID=A0ABP7AB26_9PSEU
MTALASGSWSPSSEGCTECGQIRSCWYARAALPAEDECSTAAATTKPSSNVVAMLTTNVSGLDSAALGAALHGTCTSAR